MLNFVKFTKIFRAKMMMFVRLVMMVLGLTGMVEMKAQFVYLMIIQELYLVVNIITLLIKAKVVIII